MGLGKFFGGPLGSFSGLGNFFDGLGDAFSGPFGANIGDPLDIFGTTSREFNANEAEKQRNWESYEATSARAWQEYMSNTAHQREIQDLEKAGLNPILTANGGGGASAYASSVPSGAAASTAPSQNLAALAGLLGSLGQLKNAQTNAKQVDSQSKLQQAQVLDLINQMRNRDTSTAAHVADINAKIEETAAKTEQIAWENARNKALGMTNHDAGYVRAIAHAIHYMPNIVSGAKNLPIGIKDLVNKIDSLNMSMKNELFNHIAKTDRKKYIQLMEIMGKGE